MKQCCRCGGPGPFYMHEGRHTGACINCIRERRKELSSSMRPPTRKDNKTGARGVVRCKNGKYRAQVKVNKHYLHLGYFDDVLDAICAASDYRIKHGLNDHYRRSPDGHNDQAA